MLSIKNVDNKIAIRLPFLVGKANTSPSEDKMDGSACHSYRWMITNYSSAHKSPRIKPSILPSNKSDKSSLSFLLFIKNLCLRVLFNRFSASFHPVDLYVAATGPFTSSGKRRIGFDFLKITLRFT